MINNFEREKDINGGTKEEEGENIKLQLFSFFFF